ncbi:MAG: amidohydrolase family protein [Desulfofustis sp. PB-SRB1]|nr:amidohydrolase family protein [Desulfofustis sp. PB-SRB1]
MKSTKNLTSIITIAALACGLLAAAIPTVAQDYDLVILNGRVMDPETNLDSVRNVGIKNGRITTVTEDKIAGKKAIDATGHVVAPGFIDLHAHGQNIGDYRMQAMQGVTTMLELESGVLPIGEWYDNQAGKKLPINYGASAAWTFARIAAFSGKPPSADPAYFQDAQSRTDWKMTIADPLRLGEILLSVEQGLTEGALESGSMPATLRAMGTRNTSPWPSWPSSTMWRPSLTCAMRATSSLRAPSRRFRS